MNKRPGGSLKKSSDDATKSQIIPLIGNYDELTKKSNIIPALIAIIFVVTMFFTTTNPHVFKNVTAFFLALVCMYIVYRSCGHSKPWWVMVIAALITSIAITSPLLDVYIIFFRHLLPGNIDDNTAQGFWDTLINYLFGAGLMEELFKAMPIFLFAWLGKFLASPWQERLGVNEPLDGILIGAASGMGFTLMETLGQYVPQVIQETTDTLGNSAAGDLVGLQLLIPRMLASSFGHMAYSGYFGYFIGLAILKPKSRWLILGIGYFSAALIHALWDTAASTFTILLPVVGILSYALFATAIIKARKLSQSLFTNTSIISSLILQISGKQIPLQIGTKIWLSDLYGKNNLSTDEILAEVTHNPNDPQILGLKNLSAHTWKVVIADGSNRTVNVDTGKNIRLQKNNIIDFGSIKGLVF